MESSSSEQWPDHRLKVMIPMWSLLIVSTAFLVWRVVYGLMNRRWFMVCDYLLITAGVSSLPTRASYMQFELMHHFSVPQHRSNVVDASGHWPRAWPTHTGPYCATEHQAIQLHSLDRPDHQRHRRCIPEVVDLRVAPGSELLQVVSSRGVAVDCDGYGAELPGAGFDLPGLCAAGEELEFRVSRPTHVLG